MQIPALGLEWVGALLYCVDRAQVLQALIKRTVRGPRMCQRSSGPDKVGL